MLIAGESPIFLSFDPDHGGDQAIKEYWGKYLAHAIPYRTVGGDLNDMLLEGKDVVKWAERGLQLAAFLL